MMGLLTPGDEDFHYEDGGHRWVPPGADWDQDLWERAIQAHKAKHIVSLDGGEPVRPPRMGSLTEPRAKRRRANVELPAPRRTRRRI